MAVVLLLVATPAFSQQSILPLHELHLKESGIENAGVKSNIMQAPLAGEAGLSTSAAKWGVSVRSREGRVHKSPEMANLKAQKNAEKKPAEQQPSIFESAMTTTMPNIGINFEGNWSMNLHPPDNSIAVSNGGYIVSVNNDGPEYYNTNGQVLFFDLWPDFINNSQLTSTIYDPIVAYDSGEDRFIMAVLHGSNSSTSQVIVMFSKTNNPMDGWNIYTLSGNPLNNNTWFDYPNIGISGQEVYITGNLYDNNDNFNQSIIFQIGKAQGYAGTSLNWQFWHSLNQQPFPAFTLVPTPHGHQGNLGPGMLFVSNRPGGENRVRLWELTDYMGNNPSLNVYIANIDAYSPAGDAFMPNTNLRLDNGDCRIMMAFYLNHVIHFVFHSDVGQGWNGIHYNRLDLNTLTNQTAKLGLVGSEDYSYPAIASLSMQATDPTVAIAFLRSSNNVFPSTSVVQCNASMQWSAPRQIKAGETYIDFLQGNTQRWGDYSGMARKHNAPSPQVWAAMCYGTSIPSLNLNHTYKTWVAQISSGPISVEETPLNSKVEVYPNPVLDMMNIDFYMHTREEVTIEITDMQGRPVKLLYRDTPKPGQNNLNFNKGALTRGVYFVSIKTQNTTLKHEKIVIQD